VAVVLVELRIRKQRVQVVTQRHLIHNRFQVVAVVVLMAQHSLV
jgi:hypothetical protein